MEIAARQHRLRVDEDQRIVGDRVRLGFQHVTNVVQHAEAGTDDLRLAAD